MSDPEHPGGGEPPAADPSHVLVDVGADDAARVAELEDHVWFEVSPGLSAQDITSVLDWSRTRAVERTEVPPFAPLPEDGRPLAGLYTSYPLVVSVPGTTAGSPGSRCRVCPGWACTRTSGAAGCCAR